MEKELALMSESGKEPEFEEGWVSGWMLEGRRE